MMRTLNLSEGDPVRLNGVALPKGKMVKIQAQSTDFLQVSDAKAVYVVKGTRNVVWEGTDRQTRVCSAVLLCPIRR